MLVIFRLTNYSHLVVLPIAMPKTIDSTNQRIDYIWKKSRMWAFSSISVEQVVRNTRSTFLQTSVFTKYGNMLRNHSTNHKPSHRRTNNRQQTQWLNDMANIHRQLHIHIHINSATFPKYKTSVHSVTLAIIIIIIVIVVVVVGRDGQSDAGEARAL